MPRNGSGTYNAPAGSWNPAVTGVTMDSAGWNALLPDIVQALTQSLSQDGQTQTTARIPFSQGLSLNAGSALSPAATFIGDLTSGLYQPATNQIGISAGGTSVFTATSSALTIALATTINAALTVSGAAMVGSMSNSGASSVAGAFAANGAAKIGGSGSTVGFYGATGTTQPSISGSRGGNAALASLITALANQGLCIDGTSA